MQRNLKYDLSFAAVAREDVREIVLWYKNEVDGLENRFLFSLEVIISELRDNPLIYPIQFNNIRCGLLRRFPYKVYYTIDQETVIILGVIHVKRNPKLIRKRVR